MATALMLTFAHGLSVASEVSGLTGCTVPWAGDGTASVHTASVHTASVHTASVHTASIHTTAHLYT